MDLWHLERLRLIRTNRLLMLLGVYGFFGVVGPLTARYLADILTSVGGAEMQGIVIPEPVPADGITQFISNAGQLGVLAVVVAAAGALAIDAKPELGVFLRTRVTSLWHIVTPRFVTVSVASVLALVAGTALAATLTALLIGAVDATALAVGTVYGGLYLVFVVALTAAVAGRASSVLTTVLVTVGVLIALPLLALFPQVEPWVPSELLGAADLLVRGAPLTDPLRAAVVTVLASGAALWVAVRGLSTREL